jgi:hypothetical protein
MKSPTLLLASVTLFPLLCMSAVAQQEIRIRALSFQPGFPADVHAHLPSGAMTLGEMQVKSFLNHEANLLKFNGGALVFTIKSDPVSATDVNEHIGKVEMPADLKSAILLFLPESPEPGDFRSRVIAIGDSAADFPPGSFKVANVSSLPIKIELEKEVYQFAPGETKVIAKPPFGENQAASMRAYCKRNDEWQLITSGVWPNPGSKRVLQVFTADPATRQIELKGIRDVAAP